MSASKNRLRWAELPPPVRGQISELAGGRVMAAQNCEGGFSPGFASLLTLADGRRAFAEAMDADAWPLQATFHRDEARVGGALPRTVPAPRLLGLAEVPPALRPIAAAKHTLGRSALSWLQCRLSVR
jgi:hypothetical protein